ncbi:sigma-70 family RNA polymerase sigma factor [Asaia platycodi]|uniref:sigma-70 family RNA polymerase sigma factor n=1 Tax=Asaia platycodi TaxID=610243 RepID=UPI0034E299C8
MQLSADGDQVAFGQIVSRYSGRILKLSIRITGAFEASEEISQEVLVKIWKNASAYSSSLSKFSTWMHKIVVNTCIDYMRRKKWSLCQRRLTSRMRVCRPKRRSNVKKWKCC